MKVCGILCAVAGTVLFFPGSKASGGGDAVEVRVVGKQWLWAVTQPNGVREVNEIHIPAGRKIKLVMTSQDVLHRLSLPKLQLNEELVPKRETTRTFSVTKVGKYLFSCGDDCGSKCSEMKGTVTVMSQKDYAKWLASKAQRPTKR